MRKKVTLSGAFPYWHDGCRRVVYGPGEVELEDEVAAAAEACGVLAPAVPGTPDASVEQGNAETPEAYEASESPVAQTAPVAQVAPRVSKAQGKRKNKRG